MSELINSTLPHALHTLTIPSTVNSTLRNAKFSGIPVTAEFVENMTIKAAAYLAKIAGGATIVQGRGMWIDDGKTVIEDVRRIEVIALTAEDDKKVSAAVLRLAKDIGEILRQDTVLVTWGRVQAAFI